MPPPPQGASWRHVPAALVEHVASFVFRFPRLVRTFKGPCTTWPVVAAHDGWALVAGDHGVNCCSCHYVSLDDGTVKHSAHHDGEDTAVGVMDTATGPALVMVGITTTTIHVETVGDNKQRTVIRIAHDCSNPLVSTYKNKVVVVGRKPNRVAVFNAQGMLERSWPTAYKARASTAADNEVFSADIHGRVEVFGLSDGSVLRQMKWGHLVESFALAVYRQVMYVGDCIHNSVSLVRKADGMLLGTLYPPDGDFYNQFYNQGPSSLTVDQKRNELVVCSKYHGAIRVYAL